MLRSGQDILDIFPLPSKIRIGTEFFPADFFRIESPSIHIYGHMYIFVYLYIYVYILRLSVEGTYKRGRNATPPLHWRQSSAGSSPTSRPVSPPLPSAQLLVCFTLAVIVWMFFLRVLPGQPHRSQILLKRKQRKRKKESKETKNSRNSSLKQNPKYPSPSANFTGREQRVSGSGPCRWIFLCRNCHAGKKLCYVHGAHFFCAFNLI